MNKDFRISTDFPRHPKTKKLISRLGHKGVFSLIALWAYAAERRSKGTLDNSDEETIALASCWEGDPGEFIRALCDVGFLKQNREGYVIHDWERHNPWCFHAQERSEIAREKACARWGRTQKSTDNTNNMQGACSQHAASLHLACTQHTMCNAPSPIPNPSPKPNPSLNNSSSFAAVESENKFNLLWKRYPRKLGKKGSLRHFKASVKNDGDFHRIQMALDNYNRYIKGRETQFIQHGVTWFSNWEDWLCYEETGRKEIDYSEGF